MPIQDFNLYTARGYAGDLPDSTSSVVSGTGIVEDATLGFGKALKRGTLTTDARHVKVGHSSGNVFAISRREYNHEADTRPSDGTTSYKQTDSASIMRQGFIYIKVTGRAATAGQLLNVDDATGEFTGGAAGTGETASKNVTAEQSGSVGDIIKARIDIVA